MDFYSALKQNGLGHMVPPAQKQRTHVYSAHRSTPIQQTLLKDHQRYQQTVPPEFAYGNSYVEAMKPMTRTEYKALHNHASSVFDTAIKQLQSFSRSERW